LDKIGRKIYHLTGGLVLIALYARLGRPAGLMVLAGVFIFATSLDLLRLKSQAFNSFIFAHFHKFIRESEKSKLTGTPWYVLGILSTAAIFDLPIAAYAVVFLACGDVAATSVGERWGSIKISGVKSLQGTLAFFAASVIAGFLVSRAFMPMAPAVFIAGAAVAAIVEVLPIGINDNLSVPLVSGAVMKLMLGFACSYC
jgi:glycerol-3-phosphate acyltransferase PlsY